MSKIRLKGVLSPDFGLCVVRISIIASMIFDFMCKKIFIITEKTEFSYKVMNIYHAVELTMYSMNILINQPSAIQKIMQFFKNIWEHYETKIPISYLIRI